jgi:hypothetical protein
MAVKVAIASGNFSNPAIWHTGTKPVAGDIVVANGYTVTLNENATVATLSNKVFFGLSAVPTMTGYTTPSGIASAQNEYDLVNYQAWKAFDGNWTGTHNHWIGRNGRVLPEWLQYEFVSPKVIVGYSLQTTVYDVSRATNWQFQAWNGTDWVVLDTNVGSPSQAIPYVRTFTNTVAYSRYRIFITNSNDASYISIAELRLFETTLDAQNAVAGGNFILAPNVNFTCTVSIEGSNVNLLNWTGGPGTTSTITSPILHASTGGNTFQINGAGTLNINIALATTQGGNTTIYNILNTGTINIVGSIRPWTSSDTGGNMLYISSTPTINITGDVTQVNEANMKACSIVGNCTFNMTGTLTLGKSTWPFEVSTFCTVNITGPVIGFGGSQLGLLVYTSAVLRIIGPISSTGAICTIYAPSGNTINLFSGPFIYSSYGYSPLWVARYHLIPSTTTYIEFRDSSTGGLNFPNVVAPTKRFISPSASSDSPNPTDVRLGVLYAFATLTGTLNMPTPNQVTFGVAVDNTFGNAVLTAASVWDYLVANITVENSIGMRLKNVSTPQTTGEQLEAFLRLE